MRDAHSFRAIGHFATSGLCRFAKLFLAKISASFSIYPYQYIARDIGSMSIVSIFFSSFIRCSVGLCPGARGGSVKVVGEIRIKRDLQRATGTVSDWNRSMARRAAPRRESRYIPEQSPFLCNFSSLLLFLARIVSRLFLRSLNSHFQHPRSYSFVVHKWLA